MDQKIKISQNFLENQKITDKIKRISDNEWSHFVKWTFRADVFNIKSYLTDNKKKDEILYIPYNVVALGSGWFADFVIGDWVEVEINDDNAQSVWNDIASNNGFNEIVYDMAIEQSQYWYSVAKIRKDEDGDVIIDQIPYEYFVPVFEGLYLWDDIKKIHIISKNVVQSKSWQDKARITTIRPKTDEEWIENKDWLYLIETGIYEKNGISSEWNLTEEELTEEIEFKNFYIVNNKKKGDKMLWISDYIDAFDLIEEINDRLTQVSVQFIKHLGSKISVPFAMRKFLEDQKIDMDALSVLVHKDGEQPAKYIENTNYLISDALDYIDKILRFIGAVIQIPNSFLWVEESGWAEKVEALKLRMIRFLKKVKRKQLMFTKNLKEIVKDSLKLAGVEWEFDITIKYSDEDLTDAETLAERYIEMFDKKLLSKESAIGYLMNWDKKSVVKEIKIIDAETQKNIEKTIDPNNQDDSQNQNNQEDNQDEE